MPGSAKTSPDGVMNRISAFFLFGYPHVRDLKGRAGSNSFLLKILCVGVCMPSCLYVNQVHVGVHRVQKRTSDPLELELQAVVSFLICVL